MKGKVVTGKSEFACDYAGRVFLFDNEDNLNLFEKNARKYLNKLPVLPKMYMDKLLFFLLLFCTCFLNNINYV